MIKINLTLSNMLAVLFIIVVSLTEVPAGRDVTPLFGNALQTAGPAGQMAGPVTGKIARSAADFDVFPDMSKQEQRNFTLAQVRRCAGQDGGCLYVVYNGLVLDLTQFAPHHLGGSSMLQQYGGQDATAAMLASGMSPQVFDVLVKRFVVGRLVKTENITRMQQVD